MSRQVAEGDPDLMLLEIARISNASMRRLSGPIKDWMKIVWDGWRQRGECFRRWLPTFSGI